MDVGSAPVAGVYAVVVVRLSASFAVSIRPYWSYVEVCSVVKV